MFSLFGGGAAIRSLVVLPPKTNIIMAIRIAKCQTVPGIGVSSHGRCRSRDFRYWNQLCTTVLILIILSCLPVKSTGASPNPNKYESMAEASLRAQLDEALMVSGGGSISEEPQIGKSLIDPISSFHFSILLRMCPRD